MNLLDKLEQLSARPTPLVTRWPDGDQRFVAEMKIALNDLTQLRCLMPQLLLLARAAEAVADKRGDVVGIGGERGHWMQVPVWSRHWDALRAFIAEARDVQPWAAASEAEPRCGAKMEDGERCERMDGHSGPHRELPD